MKKLSIFLSALLLCMPLAACGNSSTSKSSSKSSSVKVVHHKRKHRQKKHERKQQAKTSSSSEAKSNKSSSSQQTSGSDHQHQSQQAAQSNSSAGNNNQNSDLEWDGTRKRSSFKSDADYQRYNAWHQGYNYDPSTGSLTRMNQQQLDDMRQQMDKDGGQSFQ